MGMKTKTNRYAQHTQIKPPTTTQTQTPRHTETHTAANETATLDPPVRGRVIDVRRVDTPGLDFPGLRLGLCSSRTAPDPKQACEQNLQRPYMRGHTYLFVSVDVAAVVWSPLRKNRQAKSRSH